MPVSREEVLRYRRLLELARVQRDAVLKGKYEELGNILAERQSLLGDWPAGGKTDGEGPDRTEEARLLLRAVLEVDEECQRLVTGRLRELEAELAAMRTALEGSRAYRLALGGGQVSRLLDELK